MNMESRLQFVLLLVLLASVGADQSQEEEVKEQSPNELKPSANATESVSLLSEKERQSFLEWLFSLTGGGSAPPQPEPEPVVPSHCDSCTCGIAGKGVRIVGGRPVIKNRYPWMALLMYDGKFYCGATLISNKYVLTASHCVDGFNKAKMVVRLMEHDRATYSETTVIDRKVEKITMHGGYNDVTFNNDIALIRLDRPVVFLGDLRPVCLPPTGPSFTGYDGIVTGWGVKSQGGSTSNILNEVNVPIMSNKDCRTTNYGPRRITDNMLCAGYSEGKKDSCQGDSGGPLHVRNSTNYEIVGVVSWGEGCARPRYPGVYARVNRYITWIKKNTRDSCFCDRYGNGSPPYPAATNAGGATVPSGAIAPGANATKPVTENPEKTF